MAHSLSSMYLLGPPAIGVLSHPFLVGRFGSPAKIDYRNSHPYSNLARLEDLNWLNMNMGHVVHLLK